MPTFRTSESRSTHSRIVRRLANRSRALSVRIIRSFYFALCGIAHLFRTRRNARIELVCGVVACAVAWWAGIQRIEWAILVIMIAIVLTLKGVNTAIESVVDLASPNIHPLARTAKDVAAGMVLIAAVASIVVGLLILGPPVLARFNLA